MRSALIFFLAALVFSSVASAQDPKAKRAALVDMDGNIVNVIMMRPDIPYTPPAGLTVVDDPNAEAEPEGKYQGRKFVRKPAEPRRPSQRAARAEAREARIKAIEDENLSLKARIEALESKTTPGS